MVLLLTIDDRDINKRSPSTVRNSKGWVMTLQKKSFQIPLCTANIVRQHRQGKVTLGINLSPKRHKLSQLWCKPSFDIQTSHVKYESCRKWTFAILAIFFFMQFHVGTDGRKFPPSGRCCSVVVNPLSTVFKVSKTVIVSTHGNSLLRDKMAHTEIVGNRSWQPWHYQ